MMSLEKIKCNNYSMNEGIKVLQTQISSRTMSHLIFLIVNISVIFKLIQYTNPINEHTNPY